MPPNPQQVLGIGAPDLKEQWARFGVSRAWLFGSRVSGNATNGSDWDFVVEFSTPPDFQAFMGLKEELECRLGGRVDLLSLSACKPRFLERIKEQMIDVS